MNFPSPWLLVNPHRRAAMFCLGALMLAFGCPTAGAYVLKGSHWPSNQTVLLDLDMSGPDGTLLDGATSWNQVAEAAMAVWNPYLGSGVQLGYTEFASTPGNHDGKNSVFFSNTVFGEAFGSDTIGITVSYYDPKTKIRTEADVIFNTAKTFNSYRGALRGNASGGILEDLRRIAIHEFGHVLGLDHTPQDSVSIMTPYVSNLDTVQADDIAGVQAIYGVPPPAAPVITSKLTAFHPIGETFYYYITATHTPTSFAADGLPDGLTFNPSTGLISGSVANSGAYTINLSASNAGGTATATLVLSVGVPPTVASSATTYAILNQPFSYQITASGDFSSFTADPLPSGLSLNKTTGWITGTPTSSGSFFVTTSVVSNFGSASSRLRVNIQPDAGAAFVHSFTNNEGSNPSGILVPADDGSFYGTTQSGGSYQEGIFYHLAADGTLTVLRQFGEPGDLYGAVSSPIRGPDGNFYAVVVGVLGGIIKLTPEGTVSILHSFTTSELGYGPIGTLTVGGDGSLYGITAYSTTVLSPYSGTIFKMAPDGHLTFLYAFSGETGFSLTRGTDGFLYGATASGFSGPGRIYRLGPDGTPITLHQFTAAEGTPTSSPVLGRDGSLYGSLYTGGTPPNGAIYKWDPNSALTILHTFQGNSVLALLPGPDGLIYGTTYLNSAGQDGEFLSGILFSLTSDGTLTTIHEFGSTSSGRLIPGLTQSANGEVYGVMSTGGDSGLGAIFRTTFHTPAPVTYTPSAPKAPPTVTVEATTAQVTVGSGSKAVLTLRLSEAQTTDTVVRYTVKGSAVNGTDYAQLSGTKKIKAGQTSKPIKVVPLDAPGETGKKIVKFTLNADPAYDLGTTETLKVKILPAP